MKTAGLIGGGIVLAALMFALVAALWGWVVMLACGVLWHEFGWLKPIGFLPSCAIGIALAFITQGGRGSTSS